MNTSQDPSKNSNFLNFSQDPIMSAEELLYVFRNTYNKEVQIFPPFSASKKWKKSSIIFGGLIVLLILIPIVLSILNMVDNSSLEYENFSLKHEVSNLEGEVETQEYEKDNLSYEILSLEAKLELEIETRETLSDAIENIKSFVNYTTASGIVNTFKILMQFKKKI